jgi:hypothetical protein
VSETASFYQEWRLTLHYEAAYQTQIGSVLAVCARGTGSLTSIAAPFYHYRALQGASPGTSLTASGTKGTYTLTTSGGGGLSNGDLIQVGTTTPQIYMVVGNASNVYTVRPALLEDYSSTAIKTLSDGWPLYCAMHCPIMPAPRSTAAYRSGYGHIMRPFTIEFVQSRSRVDV